MPSKDKKKKSLAQIDKEQQRASWRGETIKSSSPREQKKGHSGFFARISNAQKADAKTTIKDMRTFL